MKTLVLLAALLVLPAVATPAVAALEWFPVCHDKDVRTGYVNVHVGVDCYPGIWVDKCLPDGPCDRYEVSLA